VGASRLFPLFGVLGVGTAAYGVGHRSGEGWALTRGLGGETETEYRPWLDEEPDWAEDESEGPDSGTDADANANETTRSGSGSESESERGD